MNKESNNVGMENKTVMELNRVITTTTTNINNNNSNNNNNNKEGNSTNNAVEIIKTITRQ